MNYNSLVYHFKDSHISPISFAEFGGPQHTYDQLKKGDKTLQQVEEEQKIFKSELGQTKSGDPEKNRQRT